MQPNQLGKTEEFNTRENVTNLKSKDKNIKTDKSLEYSNGNNVYRLELIQAS